MYINIKITFPESNQVVPFFRFTIVNANVSGKFTFCKLFQTPDINFVRPDLVGNDTPV